MSDYVTAQFTIVSEQASDSDPYVWIGKVLTNFAIAEQAIGSLCFKLNLSVSNGALTSLADLRKRLSETGERKCRMLDNRIERWNANRPYRHLLAHATISCLTDVSGKQVIVTRHLPRDSSDVTPDRTWTNEERRELLRQATSDGRSIHDHVKALLADPARLAKLRV